MLNVSVPNTAANYPHDSLTGKRPIPRLKLLLDKQLVQSKVFPASSSPIWLIWPRKTWNILSVEIIHVLGWKELPKGINQDCFNWRSVTRSAMDSHCPGYGETEYHSSSSNGNQSNASITTDELHQQRDHIIPDATLVKDYDRNWSPEEITSENDYKTLKHGNDPNDIKLSKEHLIVNVSLQTYGANYSHGNSTGKPPIPRPKPRSDKHLVRSKVLPASSSTIWSFLPRITWKILSDEIIHAFGRKDLPKGINQDCFNWRSVTRSAMDSPNFPGYEQKEYHTGHAAAENQSIGRNEKDCYASPVDISSEKHNETLQCEDPAKHLLPTPEDAPKEKVTKNSSISANSKHSITDDTAIAKIHVSREMRMPHVPFVMRMPKDYEWNRLPEHISSENEENPASSNLTDSQNRNISFESQNYPTESKIEQAWSMIVDRPSRVNDECRWIKKSGNARCVDNENKGLDFLENETSSSTAENMSSDKVSSTENNGTDLEKLLETNQLSRSHGNLSTVAEKSGDVTECFKDLDNVSLESGIITHVLTNWSWQDTFDMLIISWMINFCLADLYLTGCFIKEIIGVLRLQRQRQQEEERGRLRELKPWRPKPKKKRRKKKNDW